jgi:S1-C subfamily serine protease
MRRLVALLGAAALLAGCGGGDTRTVTQTVAGSAPAAPTAPASSSDAGRVYARDAPGVVTVVSTAGLGSGFILSEKGEIATNAHVVTQGTGAAVRRASTVYVVFPDHNQVSAKIVGVDPFSDVALLKIDPDGLDLHPLRLGTAADVQVGAPVFAIGSPFGEEQSLSAGIVSAKNRSIDSLTGFQTTGAIQTDAAINHGNSGGPLIDTAGRVLGINSQIQTTSGDGTGVGFAVPVETVKRSLDQLRASGRVRYAFLGIKSVAIYPQLAQRYKLATKTGVWVQAVTPGGPAADAGIRAGGPVERFQTRPWATGGDIIVGLGRLKIVGDDDLARALFSYEPGDTVDVKVLRDGDARTLQLKLGERPLTSPDPG